MKKLMTLMLGLSLALGSVAVAFAQDTTKKAEEEGSQEKEGRHHKELTLSSDNCRIAANAIRHTPPCPSRSDEVTLIVAAVHADDIRTFSSRQPYKSHRLQRSHAPRVDDYQCALRPHMVRHPNQGSPRDSRRIPRQHVRRVMHTQVDPREPDRQRARHRRAPHRQPCATSATRRESRSPPGTGKSKRTRTRGRWENCRWTAADSRTRAPDAAR